MAEDSSFQIFDLRKYLDRFYYLSKKPGEEPELLEFILIKLHNYMKEGNRYITSRASFNHVTDRNNCIIDCLLYYVIVCINTVCMCVLFRCTPRSSFHEYYYCIPTCYNYKREGKGISRGPTWGSQDSLRMRVSP